VEKAADVRRRPGGCGGLTAMTKQSSRKAMETDTSTEPVGAQASAGSLISAAAILGAKGGKAGRGAAKARTSKQARDAANARWKRAKTKKRSSES